MLYQPLALITKTRRLLGGWDYSVSLDSGEP